MRRRTGCFDLAVVAFFITAVIPLPTRTASAAEAICSSAAVIFCEDFEAGPAALPGIWTDAKTTNMVITSTAANVFAGQYALQVNWPAGQEAGWLSRWFRPDGQPAAPATGFDHVYARAYFKPEGNWSCAPNCFKSSKSRGSQISNPWSAFGTAGRCATGRDFYAAMLATAQAGPFNQIFYTYYPDMPCAQPAGQNYGEYIFFSPVRQAALGGWTCLELEVQANTPGQKNGLQRAWIDGVLAGETLNMRWRDTTALTNNVFSLSFSGLPAAATHMWVDNVVVSTQRIGCASPTVLSPSAPADLVLQ